MREGARTLRGGYPPMCGDTLALPSTARVGSMSFSSSLMRAGVAAATAWVGGTPLLAATVIAFDGLTPTLSGDGNITFRGDTAAYVSVNTVSGFGLAALPGGDPGVMFMPAFSSTQGFLFDTGLTVGNGGSGNEYINQYTMIFDIYWAENNPWYAFYNAEGLNNGVNDADFFRRGSDGAIGVGNGGYYGSAAIGEWNRVAFTVTNTDAATTTLSIYLNGNYLGDSVRVGGTDGRFSLYLSGEGNQTALFTDNDGETAPAYLSQFFFDARVYSPAEIAALGGPSAAAIPEPTGLLLLAGAGLLGRRLRRHSLRRAPRPALV